jgi:hypothetical protein
MGGQQQPQVRGRIEGVQFDAWERVTRNLDGRRRVRQPLLVAAGDEIDDETEPDSIDAGPTEDTESPDLDASRDLRRSGEADARIDRLDDHLIVGDQRRPDGEVKGRLVQQAPEREVRFASA